MDTEAMKGLVEDFWRTFIPLAQSGRSDLATEAGGRFEQRIADTAALMHPVDATNFLKFVDAYRDIVLSEYHSNPAALKRRLGIALGNDAAVQQVRSYRHQTLGDVAVRTAVRATVWESIWALFRVFR